MPQSSMPRQHAALRMQANPDYSMAVRGVVRAPRGDELLNLDTADHFQFRGTWRKKRSNISHGGLTEESAVFAIELGCAFVADLKSRAGGIKAVVQHQTPR